MFFPFSATGLKKSGKRSVTILASDADEINEFVDHESKPRVPQIIEQNDENIML